MYSSLVFSTTTLFTTLNRPKKTKLPCSKIGRPLVRLRIEKDFFLISCRKSVLTRSHMCFEPVPGTSLQDNLQYHKFSNIPRKLLIDYGCGLLSRRC